MLAVYRIAVAPPNGETSSSYEPMVIEDPGTAGVIATIAYFSMEIGLDEHIPTYAGGLGVLAGDTTPTPVAAGHDQFPLSLVARVITGYGHDFDERAREFCLDGVLNMTYLALDHSHYVNGVAKRHGETARLMFAQRKIDSITNGVPSLSILDGWWVEGCIEGVTGWAIGGNGAPAESDDDRAADAASLDGKLEHVILPMFYSDRDRYVEVMRHAMTLNGSFFNTERMVDQHVRKAHFE